MPGHRYRHRRWPTTVRRAAAPQEAVTRALTHSGGSSFSTTRTSRRPPVITDDMLHTVLRRRANGESIEDIRRDLIIPNAKRKGRNPSPASIYRALVEHEKRQMYPEAVEHAHADFAELQAST